MSIVTARSDCAGNLVTKMKLRTCIAARAVPFYAVAAATACTTLCSNPSCAETIYIWADRDGALLLGPRTSLSAEQRAGAGDAVAGRSVTESWQHGNL